MVDCLASCICRPFVTMYKGCCHKPTKPQVGKVTTVATATFDPAAPYRSQPIQPENREAAQAKVKKLKSYRSPKVIRDE
jgi:hypothetical protein